MVLSRETFVARYGGVFEHSAWIAAEVFDRGLGPEAETAAGLHARFVGVMRAAPDAAKLALIRAHPDLAGKLARAGRLTKESTQEQASAGLDHLTDAERARFTELNAAYTQKFGFPFIIAVKGRGKAAILADFESRLPHGADTEFQTALAEIETIALLRLQAMLPLIGSPPP